MTIDGSGQNVTLDGQNQMRVLQVNNGINFTLNSLTIAHGFSSDIGAGLWSWGTVNINNSTIADNVADNYAGGLYNLGTMSISNSTVANNSATYGGGMLNDGGNTVNISNSTFANNSSTQGGGIDNGGTINVSNSLFANSGGNCVNGTTNDQGYNLSSDSTCGFSASTSQQNIDPLLDPNGLQNNGGLTQTIALQQGSPAIDQIPVASCPATDQRGFPRPDDSETTCDIGAYESGAALPDDDLALTNMPANITTDATTRKVLSSPTRRRQWWMRTIPCRRSIVLHPLAAPSPLAQLRSPARSAIAMISIALSARASASPCNPYLA